MTTEQALIEAQNRVDIFKDYVNFIPGTDKSWKEEQKENAQSIATIAIEKEIISVGSLPYTAEGQSLYFDLQLIKEQIPNTL